MQWRRWDRVEMQWDSGDCLEIQWVSGDCVEMQRVSGDCVEMQWVSADYVVMQWDSGTSKCGLLFLERKLKDTKCVDFKFTLRPTPVLFRCTFFHGSCLFFLVFGPSYAYSIKVQLLTGTQ